MRSEFLNGVHFGGGLDAWISDRVGLKVEARENIYFYGGGHRFDYMELMVGVMFRSDR
jgi:hypothetical protein